MYDINPVPYGETLSLDVFLDDSRIDLDLAFETAPFYGLKRVEAEKIAREMLTVIKKQWRDIAAACGLGRTAQQEMAPAFALSDRL